MKSLIMRCHQGSTFRAASTQSIFLAFFAFMLGNCLMSPTAALAQDRVALVIGINNYVNAPKLQRAINDAESIEQRLKEAKFDTTLVENPDQRTFLEELSKVSSRIKPGDIVAIYYAGHGVEIDGRNYLVPADIPKVNSGQKFVLTSLSIPVDQIISELHAQSPSVILLILDACRDNPFNTSTTRGMGAVRGLVPVEGQPDGTYVIYSAAANQAALDSLGPDDRDPNSVFARVLIGLLGRPGITLKGLATELRTRVKQIAGDVGHDQFPAVYDQLDGDLLLQAAAEPIAPEPDPAAKTVEAPPTLPDSQSNLSFICGLGRADWTVLENSKSCNALKVFIESYHSCPVLSALAQDKMIEVCSAPTEAAQAENGTEPTLPRGKVVAVAAQPAEKSTVPVVLATPKIIIPASALNHPFFAVMSANGSRGLVLSGPSIATAFDTAAGTLDWRLATTDLKDASMDREGRVVFGINREGRIVEIRSPYGQPVVKELQLPPLATSVAVSPDASTLAAVFADGSLMLVSAADGQVKASLSGDGRVMLGVGFSTDGRQVVSWSMDGALHAWSAKDLASISSFASAAVPAGSIALSEDNRRILVSRLNGALEILDAKSGLSLAQHDLGGAIRCAAFAGAMDQVMFVGDDGDLIAWDWANGKDSVKQGAHVGTTCALTSGANSAMLHGVGDEIGVFSLVLP